MCRQPGIAEQVQYSYVRENYHPRGRRHKRREERRVKCLCLGTRGFFSHAVGCFGVRPRYKRRSNETKLFTQITMKTRPKPEITHENPLAPRGVPKLGIVFSPLFSLFSPLCIIFLAGGDFLMCMQN